LASKNLNLYQKKAMQKLFIVLISIIFFQSKTNAQSADLKSLGYIVLDSTKGASLYKKNLEFNGLNSIIILQVIDIQQVKIEQLASIPHGGVQPEGLYLNQKNLSKSPFFKMYAYQNAIKQAQKRFEKKMWGLMNAAFFEQYGDSTQIAFPLKINGKIVTTGSSPYGPQRNPKKEYYKNTTLKALVWNETTVSIENYNTETGEPLTDQKIKNALVSYDYKDHPAKALYGDTPNRYHVLGTKNNHLYMLTVDKTSLENAAQQLRALGISGDIMTIDGGVSVFIFNQKKGVLALPSNKEKKLPHYLVFVKK
jgi:hypothetical protein